MPISKRLYRSREDRIVAGVFGGLGEYYEIDPVVLRLAFIVVLVVTVFFPGILIYILAIFVIPLEPASRADYEASADTSKKTNSEKSESDENDESISVSRSTGGSGTPTKQESSSTEIGKEDTHKNEEKKNADTPSSQPPIMPPSRRDDPLW